MAKAFIEVGGLASFFGRTQPVHASAYRSTSLTVDGTGAVTAAALVVAADPKDIRFARITAQGSDLIFAVGKVPDVSVAQKTDDTSAARFLASGATIEVAIDVDGKVAVKAA